MPQQPVSGCRCSKPILSKSSFSANSLPNFLVVQRVDRLLMAVPVNEGLAVESRGHVVRRFAAQKIAEGERQLLQTPRVFVVREACSSTRLGTPTSSSAPAPPSACRRGSRAGAFPEGLATTAGPCPGSRSRRAAGRSTRRPVGTSTRKPASSSTSVAAMATSGWKWLLNVSANSTTGGPEFGRGPRARNQCLNVCGAKAGICRRGCTPSDEFRDATQARQLREEIRQRGSITRRAVAQM